MKYKSWRSFDSLSIVNSSLLQYFEMCRYRQVNIYYTVCGHGFPQPDEVISCADTKCVFSPNHGAACTPSTCRQICWQRFQYPQQYSPHVAALCPRCNR